MTQHWTAEQISRFDSYLQEAHHETAQIKRNRNPSSSSGSSEQGYETESSDIQMAVNITDMDDPEAVPWEEEEEPTEEMPEEPPEDWFLD